MSTFNPFGGVDLVAAANGNVHLLRALQGIQDQFLVVNGGPAVAPLKLSTGAVVAPPLSPFTVVGSQGKFVIDITPPQTIVQPSPLQKRLAGQFNIANAQVYYQLRSADDEAMSVNLVTYGQGTAVHIEILQPNTFKFWQMRSQYANSAWTSWQPFTDPSVCGPVQVWSGLITSTATSLVNQGCSYAGSSPLTQSGTSSQILVAATTWHAGSETLQYGAGSVDPGAFGLFYVYADDPARQGGSVLYVATSDVTDLVALDGRLYFGNITTASGGGGTGGGGGGGACVSGDSLITMWDGSKRPQRELWRGDRVRGIDGEIDTVVNVEMHAGMPCFINEFDNGIITKAFSSRHPLKYAGGGFGLNFEILPDEQFTTEHGVAKLKRKMLTFPQTVYAMTLDRSFTFWADGVGSHNARFMGK